MWSCLPSAGCCLLSLRGLCCCWGGVRGCLCSGSQMWPWQQSRNGFSGTAACSVRVSCCPSSSEVVAVCVGMGSASVAIVTRVDSSRVVVGMQWIRKKCPFHKLWEEEWVAIQSLVAISCCILSFCRKTSADPEEHLFDPECQTCFTL